MSKPSMNPALRPFWSKPSRGKVLYGGRDSTKSWDAAANTVRITSNVKVRVLCTRMFQNRIAGSVYTLINDQIDRFGMRAKYTTLNNAITCHATGSVYMFYGLARNIDEIRSLEGVDILWIEEAHNLTKEMWDALEPTIRRNGSEVWIIFNPNLATDFAYQRFVVNPPDGFVVRKINYDENPYLSETSKGVIASRKGEDEESYRHVYLGEPKENDEGSIIKRSHLNSCIDAHEKLGVKKGGQWRLGFDIGDTGDACATAATQGVVLRSLDMWQGKEDELKKSTKRAYDEARGWYASELEYDRLGIGAFCGSEIKELNKKAHPLKPIEYYAFNAGGKVANPKLEYQDKVLNGDMFENLKAQRWTIFADRVRMTHNAVTKGEPFDASSIVSLSSECAYLETAITELSTPRKDLSKANKRIVESKKNLAARGVPSHNVADAVIMAYPAPELRRGSIVW